MPCRLGSQQLALPQGRWEAALGLGCGQIVLTVAVIAILVTAPLGALAIDRSYTKLLTQRPPE